MHNLLELCGITLDDLRELYDKERSIYRVQKYLGVSRPTITKWLRIAGVQTLGHRPFAKPTTSMAGEFGPIAVWIREHPAEKLPRSIKLAAEKIGCSERALRSYLYRRNQRVLRYVKSLGDLKNMAIIISTVDGKNINPTYIDEYEYSFDSRTYIVRINVRIKDTHFHCEYPLKKFLTLLRSSATV